ncbi:MAG: hypothetical protein QXI16_01485 [Sulfolobaceae archaeon]
MKKGQSSSVTWALAIIVLAVVGLVLYQSGVFGVPASLKAVPSPTNVTTPSSTTSSTGGQVNVYATLPQTSLSAQDAITHAPINVSFSVFDGAMAPQTASNTGSIYTNGASVTLPSVFKPNDVVYAVTYGNGYLPAQSSNETIQSTVNVINVENYKAGNVTLRSYLSLGAPTNATNSSYLVLSGTAPQTYVNFQAQEVQQSSLYEGPSIVVYYNTSDIQSVSVTPANGGSALTAITNTPQRLLQNYNRPYTAVVFPLKEASLSNQASSQTYSLTITPTSQFANAVNGTVIYTQIVPAQDYICSSTTGAVNGVCAVNGVNYQTGQIVPAQYEDLNHNAIANQNADSNIVPIYVSPN